MSETKRDNDRGNDTQSVKGQFTFELALLLVVASPIDRTKSIPGMIPGMYHDSLSLFCQKVKAQQQIVSTSP